MERLFFQRSDTNGAGFVVHGHIMACINVVLGMKRDMIYCLGGCGYGYYGVKL